MFKVKTNDGMILEAANAADLVDLLNESSFAPAADAEDYMLQTSDRVKDQIGADICIDDAERFIADLLKVGLLKKVKDDENADDDSH